ncbi:unknown protein [Simkania negevensis Z]|uniref:Uncharacterized protein n=1 Tax=Simkania negevensis (strain ATCC VR-1471 / DSM 27360 / Z) TaxID=331113 RepID=F8L706_SIMNZ|nr:unknown protein [Simkania negevensis Z]
MALLVLHNLNSGFLSLILRDFSLSSQPFCLEKDRLALPIGKNTEHLRELFLLRLSKINPELRFIAKNSIATLTIFSVLFLLLKSLLVSWTMWSILGEKNSAKIWIELELRCGKNFSDLPKNTKRG